MLDLNNLDASKVILSDIQEKIFGIEKAMSTFLSWLDNFCLIHVSLISVLGVVGEQKKKPTQHSVRELRALGLTPHLLTSRCTELTRAFTTVRHINKTDVFTLDITFQSCSHIIGAFCGRSNSPWLGEYKLTGLSKKPVTLSWEDNNCSTMEISGLEIGWGQVMDESSCLD
ncbi:hypothetical protein Fmac_020298 [Flemingia macrophylla]|uniref:CTP synthase N-terminal domain-containing protein n=1 Tax=Flemingia macrophylla TaxID=520843 RepID=A0ABD1LTS3_9FABA